MKPKFGDENKCKETVVADETNSNAAEKTMKDAMAFDTEEALNEKKEKWMDIFQRCPDFANEVIGIFTSKGEDGVNELYYKFITQTV